jgi:septal ring factor EnvC (AmiA/AmiB activator)
MTGYGLLLIIDHGNGYMSLYAHSDALLKDVGTAVKRGDAVATAVLRCTSSCAATASR